MVGYVRVEPTSSRKATSGKEIRHGLKIDDYLKKELFKRLNRIFQKGFNWKFISMKFHNAFAKARVSAIAGWDVYATHNFTSCVHIYLGIFFGCVLKINFASYGISAAYFFFVSIGTSRASGTSLPQRLKINKRSRANI